MRGKCFSSPLPSSIPESKVAGGYAGVKTRRFLCTVYMFRIVLISFLLFPVSQITAYGQIQNISPKREFRGVWIATVQNIDWPSKRGLNSDIQKQELLKILDEHERSKMNAIMLQIRPSADALYAKNSEEWSIFLSGKQGLPPSPLYDPLEFSIREAHKRGMELHAWINPYRATNNLLESEISENHITRKHPEWFFTYSGKKYFNPGLPEVQRYIVRIIMGIVRNYDIDGIHFDDYFYPYPAKDALPDSASFQLHGQNFKDINDWRRHNVDTLIKTLSDSIHKEKRHVKFGISPFGIWRNLKDDPEGSESNGLSGYSALFADARNWLKQGWIDYINPQLYFPFHYPAAPYEKLQDWWSLNSFGKHVYIGHGVYRAMEDREGWRDKQQLSNQIRYLRKDPRVQGSVFFSSKSLTNNLAGFQDSLRTSLYQFQSLPPTMLWLDAVDPQSPLNLKARLSSRTVDLSWEEPMRVRDGETAYGYVIYRFDENEPVDIANAAKIIKISYEKNDLSFIDQTPSIGKKYKYVVTAVDRLKNESAPSNTVWMTIK